MDLKSKTDLLQYSDLEVEKVLAKNKHTGEDAQKDVEAIWNWMKEQKHFPFVFNGRQIFSFLNNCKFSVEKAKTAIDMYFTLKGEFQEFYCFGRNHPKLTAFQNNYYLFPLPKLSKNQGRIMVSQATDPKYFDCDVFFCMFCHMVEVLNSEDVNSGWEFLLDLTYASTEMLQKFTPEKLVKMYFILEKTYLNRILSIHLVTSSVTEKFMETLIKNSKPSTQKKIVAHKTYETLMDYFSNDIMPKDFGGNLKPLKEFGVDWQKYYQDYSAHLEKHMNARTSENLRTFKITDEEVLQFEEKIGKHILL